MTSGQGRCAQAPRSETKRPAIGGPFCLKEAFCSVDSAQAQVAGVSSLSGALVCLTNN